MSEYNRWSIISPIDGRYRDDVAPLHDFLTEEAFTRYKLKVEKALATVLGERGLCGPEVVAEIVAACDQVTTQEVYDEEKKTRHDIRALVNCIQRRVSPAARPFVHLTATSYDINNSADAARYKAAMEQRVIPKIKELIQTLDELADREAETLQIGRTHGQHAVPITFGCAVAWHVDRLCQTLDMIELSTEGLAGKFSGAVGAYNASSLFFEDPRDFEADVLSCLNLRPALVSTQIVPPEPLLFLLTGLIAAAGVMADLARSLRHLQRTEIGEVGEAFTTDQVGSSTMPQKQNPINFENVESMWKIVLGRSTTIFMDQLSEHQRDLTNSASGRTYGEIFAYVYAMTVRLKRTMTKLVVNNENMERNFQSQAGFIIAEPLYVILAAAGHPDAHEKVRTLTLTARGSGQTLYEAYLADPELASYRERMTERQREILADPRLYIGIAPRLARMTADMNP